MILLNAFLILFSLCLGCPNNPKCKACDRLENDKKTCKVCQYSVMDNLTQECVSPPFPIENCIIYQLQQFNKCQVCEFGYGVNETGNCKLCHNDCASCKDNNCLSCFNNILPIEFSCLNSKQHCDDFNCDICGYKGDCKQCKEGFSYVEGKCVEGIPNCYLMNKDKTCKECNNGYYVNCQYQCASVSEGGCFRTIEWIFVFAFITLLMVLIVIFFYRKLKRGIRQQMNDVYIDID